jgi:hypothetical protein
MKFVVINYTGTVGKTSLAVHLLAPRLDNAPIFAIESVNETAAGLGVDVSKIRGDKYRELLRQIMLLDHAIIDVGASNVEAFLDGMLRYEGSFREFDRFIIPVTNGIKEQKETMSMVNTLAEMGVEPIKIRIVFNRVLRDVAEEFAPLLAFVKKEMKCQADRDAAVFENELFDMLQTRKMTIAQALADETDYRTMARSISSDGDTKLRSQYTAMHLIQSLSRGVDRNLERAFSALLA